MTAGRDITTALRDAFLASSVSLVHFVKLEFDSGDLLVHTGIGDLVFDGETYLGVGNCLGLSFPSETAEVRAAGGTITLNGCDPSVLAIADTENYQGRLVTIWTGAMDLTTGLLIADPSIEFRGYMDTMEPLDEGASATVILGVEGRNAAFDRPSEHRYTPEDQQQIYPDDKGFDYVAGLQDKSIVWGI